MLTVLPEGCGCIQRASITNQICCVQTEQRSGRWCQHRAAQQGSAFGQLPDMLLLLILEQALSTVVEERDTIEERYQPSKWGDYQRRAFEGRLDMWATDWQGSEEN